MPRGMRATHATGGATWDTDPKIGPVILSEDWVVASCWCNAGFVMVQQRSVRDGRTGTCGRSWCTPPSYAATDGTPVVMAGSNWRYAVSDDFDKAERRDPMIAIMRNSRRALRAVNAQPAGRDAVVRVYRRNATVEARRQRVLAMRLRMQQRGAVQQIAETLRLPYQTIVNDLSALRRDGHPV